MFDLSRALNEVGEILFNIRYTGKEQAIPISNPPVKDFTPKLIRIGDDKAMDVIGFKIFGSECPEILNRREPAWIDSEWYKVKRFDAAIRKGVITNDSETKFGRDYSGVRPKAGGGMVSFGVKKQNTGKTNAAAGI